MLELTQSRGRQEALVQYLFGLTDPSLQLSYYLAKVPLKFSTHGIQVSTYTFSIKLPEVQTALLSQISLLPVPAQNFCHNKQTETGGPCSMKNLSLVTYKLLLNRSCYEVMQQEKANLQSCSQTGCQSESRTEAQQDQSIQSHHAPHHPEKKEGKELLSCCALWKFSLYRSDSQNYTF